MRWQDLLWPTSSQLFSCQLPLLSKLSSLYFYVFVYRVKIWYLVEGQQCDLPVLYCLFMYLDNLISVYWTFEFMSFLDFCHPFIIHWLRWLSFILHNLHWRQVAHYSLRWYRGQHTQSFNRCLTYEHVGIVECCWMKCMTKILLMLLVLHAMKGAH